MAVRTETKARLSPESASLSVDPILRITALVEEFTPALLRLLDGKGNSGFAGLYRADPKDHLLLPNCARASEFLGERLRERGLPAQEMVCHAMPLESAPWYFRRGRDPMPQAHLLLLVGDGNDRVVVDPTYKQFLTHHVMIPGHVSREQECEYVKNVLSALPDILLCRERDLPAFIDKAARVLIENGAAGKGGSFSHPNSVHQYLAAVFNLNNYSVTERKYSEE